MKLELIQIKDLTPDPNNARSHNDANLKAIESSLREFGQRKPIVIDSKNVVVAGNGTLTAAISLGWKDIQAVRVPADWTADRIKAFALADNRTAELAEWNSIKLAEQLLDLEAVAFDIETLGFDAKTSDPEKELDEFPSFSDDTDTAYRCPKCSYEWNGAAR
jgi:ParB-like chromosome segregation protein Spo0J